MKLYKPWSNEVPLLAMHQTICWVFPVRHYHSVEFQSQLHATNTSSLRCSVVILRPSMLRCSSLLPIDSTVDSMAPFTHAVKCIAIDLVSCHTKHRKQGLNRTCRWSSSFQDFRTNSGYSLCKYRLTSSLSYLLLQAHHIICKPDFFFFQCPCYKDFLCLRYSLSKLIRPSTA